MSFQTNIEDAFVAAAGRDKLMLTLLTGNIENLGGLLTTNKTNVVAALNEVRQIAIDAAGGGGGAVIDDATPSTTTVYSSSKTESAIAAAVAAIEPGDQIDDATVSLTSTYSSTKIVSAIDTAVAALVDGAPEALDTLKELSDALAANTGVVDGILAALALRVRVDAAQGLDATQQLQGRANIGAVSAADIGDVNADFLGAYQAGLV